MSYICIDVMSYIRILLDSSQYGYFKFQAFVRSKFWSKVFPKKNYKKANFSDCMKEIFLAKGKENEKKKKAKKVRIEVFQENQRVRNLKQLIAKNYFMQINKSFFFLNGDFFMYFMFHL